MITAKTFLKLNKVKSILIALWPIRAVLLVPQTLVTNQRSPFYFISSALLRGGAMPLFGSHCLIWTGGGGSRTRLRAGDTFPKL